MMGTRYSRRDFLSQAGAAAAVPWATSFVKNAGVELSTFSVDVTPPLGHPLMGGGVTAAQRIEDPLLARGFVLRGASQPIVVVTIDWCEIRNDAYEQWRERIATAVDTEPVRVLVTSIHQHDAPIADLEAQRILDQHGAASRICDIELHGRAVDRVAQAARASLATSQPITHVGTGKARVERVGSNRRYLARDGSVAFSRTSATRDEWAREQPEGTIDPWLKTMSFWNADRAVAALSCYATHPMSYYGQGGVTSDFVGLARARRQAADPSVFQIYASGCSGNVTAGKYNDGSPEKRFVLRDRMEAAMAAAWRATERHRIEDVAFRSTSLELLPRESPGFTQDDLQRRLETDPRPFGQCLAAMGLSWRKRLKAGRPIDVPVVDFGFAKLLLMPAESYVEYQLAAQQMRPNSFVLVMGYGECAPGYIPTERAIAEGDTNLRDWCWIAPEAEELMTEAMRGVLVPKAL